VSTRGVDTAHEYESERLEGCGGGRLRIKEGRTRMEESEKGRNGRRQGGREGGREEHALA